MRSKLQKIGLISAGIVLGVALTLNYAAVADREATRALPLDEVRTFADLYVKIKSDYFDFIFKFFIHPN